MTDQSHFTDPRSPIPAPPLPLPAPPIPVDDGWDAAFDYVVERLAAAQERIAFFETLTDINYENIAELNSVIEDRDLEVVQCGEKVFKMHRDLMDLRASYLRLKDENIALQGKSKFRWW